MNWARLATLATIVSFQAVFAANYDLRRLQTVLAEDSKVVFATGLDASTVFSSSSATGTFIVVFELGVDTSALTGAITALSAGNNDPHQPYFIANIDVVYDGGVITGLVCTMSAEAVAVVSALPGVALVEQDAPVYAMPRLRRATQASLTPVAAHRALVEVPQDILGNSSRLVPGVHGAGAGTQASPAWGLDRIDQIARPMDGFYRWVEDGAGVDGEHKLMSPCFH